MGDIANSTAADSSARAFAASTTAGAHTAYPHSRDDTLSFFARFGFAGVETWTTLSGS